MIVLPFIYNIIYNFIKPIKISNKMNMLLIDLKIPILQLSAPLHTGLLNLFPV